MFSLSKLSLRLFTVQWTNLKESVFVHDLLRHPVVFKPCDSHLLTFSLFLRLTLFGVLVYFITVFLFAGVHPIGVIMTFYHLYQPLGVSLLLLPLLDQQISFMVHLCYVGAIYIGPLRWKLTSNFVGGCNGVKF